MAERDYAPLSGACVRGLCDKLYEKRKFAGVEIEKMVKDFSDANNTNQIKRLIRVLGQDLMSSTNPNVKNGALMGLSSVAVGLGKGSATYTSELTHPIVACLGESEARVRYAAAEALFNVLKIAREAALAQFPLVFDALARLAADPEPQVRQGAELLDRLVKDIVTESPALELARVVPLVRERMYTRSAAARQFAVAWVSALDAAPALGLRKHLPDLLDGLFTVLDDPNPEIRRMCDVQLNEFLRSIKKDPSEVDFQAMINILITHAQSTEELLQLTAITWLKEFAELSGASVLPHASGVLRAALPCLAYTDEPRKSILWPQIRETAATVNLQLTKLVSEAGGGEGRLQLDAAVDVLTQLLHHSSVHTKVAALDWILHLYNKLPAEMYVRTERVFVSVVGCLTDGADDVVRRALAVLAEICSCAPATAAATGDLENSPYYHKFLNALLRLLAADENLLEDRGAFIIRQLVVLVGAEAVYRGVAGAARAREPRLAARLADVLATLLLTAPELHALRLRLRAFDDEAAVSLFRTLYLCWAHSPVALLALCLLTHNYAHCAALISTFGDLEITVDFLTEVDKLVQLIESPVFAYLRLELLGGPGSAELRAALFGLLMLLPQSEAFHMLRRRLHCAPHVPAPAQLADGQSEAFHMLRRRLHCAPHVPAPAQQADGQSEAFHMLRRRLHCAPHVPAPAQQADGQSEAFHMLRRRLHCAPHVPAPAQQADGQSEAFHMLRRRLHCAPHVPAPAQQADGQSEAFHMLRRRLHCAPHVPAPAQQADGQSEAFHMLRRRLHCAPHVPAPAQQADGARQWDIDFAALLAEFRRVQALHREHRLLERRLSRSRLFDPRS
ncbi:protein VAC14 homolog [Melitaea cinxia]|uniref:protein VAC14 homolog n=1 Tax=Melitaea cinxia TaxID=113334 RepID=UPI001E2710C5|nr:protein VAC14 homolog [Melitaea cinxia]